MTSLLLDITIPVSWSDVITYCLGFISPFVVAFFVALAKND